MEIENKIYSIAEMREPAIFTADYCFMDAPCTVIGTLLLKAQAHGKMLRLFFRWRTEARSSPWSIGGSAIWDSISSRPALTTFSGM